jgi:hypothetical protein
VRAKLKGVKTFDFKGLRPDDGDILVIRTWPGFSNTDHEIIVKALNENIKADIVTLFVKSLSSVRLLSERQLNAVGLQRIENPGSDVPELAHTKDN